MIGRLAIIGASGHGKVVADIAVELGIDDIVFFDDKYRVHKSHYGYPVLGDITDAVSWESSRSFDFILVAIGNNSVRKDIQSRFNRICPPLIHPKAVVSKTVTIENGTVVLPGAVINADTKVGSGCIINTGAIIEHDCEVGDFTHVSPNATLAGGVLVGSCSWIGMGSSVVQLCKIGDQVVVGAGALVLDDVASDQKVMGVPAKLV